MKSKIRRFNHNLGKYVSAAANVLYLDTDRTAGLPFGTQTGQFLCIEIKHTPEKGLFIAVLYSSDSDMQNNGGDFKVNQNRADIHNGGNQRGSHQRRVQMDMFCNQRQAAADKFRQNHNGD